VTGVGAGGGGGGVASFVEGVVAGSGAGVTVAEGVEGVLDEVSGVSAGGEGLLLFKNV
jgi:hypothetical protein